MIFHLLKRHLKPELIFYGQCFSSLQLLLHPYHDFKHVKYHTFYNISITFQHVISSTDSCMKKVTLPQKMTEPFT
jgi:hypothetical protein